MVRGEWWSGITRQHAAEHDAAQAAARAELDGPRYELADPETRRQVLRGLFRPVGEAALTDDTVMYIDYPHPDNED
jgi:hypothetical protein